MGLGKNKDFSLEERRNESTNGSSFAIGLQPLRDLVSSSGQCVLLSSSNASSSVLLLFTIWISRVKSRNTEDAQVGCSQKEGPVILLSNVSHVVSVAAVHLFQGKEQKH